ncbi:MAG: IS701 family transposase [Dehalococcoidia bacterium]|nr:IS701 family transposase [Dehalococcoidia bacterium]
MAVSRRPALRGTGVVRPCGGGNADEHRISANPTIKLDTTPVEGRVCEIRPITIITVDHTPWEPLWDHLVRDYHPLGYRKMLGRRLKQIAFSGGRPIAAAGWRAASLTLGARDRFIGWSPVQREYYLSHLVNNSRFLILPWVQVRHLASHLLARFVHGLCRAWPDKYGQPVWLLETFVDPQRFAGTVYRAANWIHVGTTRGFTRDGPRYRYHGHPKEVFLYVVKRDLQDYIHRQPSPSRRCRRPPVLREGDLLMRLQTDDWHPALLEESGITEAAVEELADVLVSFHDDFSPAFNRPVQLALGTTYLKGLLSDLERKSVEPIALRYLGDRHVRALQRFLTDSPWDEDLMWQLYRERQYALIGSDDGVLTIDSSEFPKQGKDSVGVARQYCGRLGKTANCQSGVFLGYASDRGYGLLAAQPYMPEQWFAPDYAARRRACGVPKSLAFQTKPEIAEQLIQVVRTEGRFAARWLACDATFGSDPAFRDAMAAHYYYLAQVRSNIKVWLEPPKMGVPPYRGHGPRPVKPRPMPSPQPVSEVANDSNTVWRPVSINTARGPVKSEMARRRVIEERLGLPHQECWLFMRRDPGGAITFYFSNAPADIPFEVMSRVSLLRWPIEQCFKEGKGQVGMDHYEIRSWRAWHRHMLYVCLAMLFLLEVRYRFAKKGALYLS